VNPLRNISTLNFDYSSEDYSEQFLRNLETRGFHTDVIDELQLRVHPRGIAIICTAYNLVTHIGIVRKSGKVAAKKSRVRIENIKNLESPIQLVEGVQLGTKMEHLFDGLIFNVHWQIWNRFVEEIRKTQNDFDSYKALFEILTQFSSGTVGRFEEVNGFQKDALVFLLKTSGLEPRDFGIDTFDTRNDAMPEFLKTIEVSKVREDVMIIHDSKVFGDRKIVDGNLICTTFSDRRNSLTVMYSNRLPLEEVLGVDLIYIDDTNRSMVVVQYKRLTGGKVKKYRPGSDSSYEKQTELMNNIVGQLASDFDETYRYNSELFYFKLCKDVQAIQNRDLVDGMYIPFDYWKKLLKTRTELSYDAVPNHLNNTTFVNLLKTGLVGCPPASYEKLSQVIEEILHVGHSVVLGMRQNLTSTST
jgi:hypothetical protein